MAIAKGYIIRDQKISLQQPEQFEASFRGIPNNGEKTVLLGPASSFNLIGNPYLPPSI
jgi:hypothetical protein